MARLRRELQRQPHGQRSMMCSCCVLGTSARAVHFKNQPQSAAEVSLPTCDFFALCSYLSLWGIEYPLTRPLRLASHKEGLCVLSFARGVIALEHVKSRNLRIRLVPRNRAFSGCFKAKARLKEARPFWPSFHMRSQDGDTPQKWAGVL